MDQLHRQNRSECFGAAVDLAALGRQSPGERNVAKAIASSAARPGESSRLPAPSRTPASGRKQKSGAWGAGGRECDRSAGQVALGAFGTMRPSGRGDPRDPDVAPAIAADAACGRKRNRPAGCCGTSRLQTSASRQSEQSRRCRDEMARGSSGSTAEPRTQADSVKYCVPALMRGDCGASTRNPSHDSRGEG